MRVRAGILPQFRAKGLGFPRTGFGFECLWYVRGHGLGFRPLEALNLRS